MARATIALAAGEASSLIHTVYTYRFLSFQQLRRLHPAVTHASLELLVNTRYIAAIKRPTLKSRAPEVIYALDRRGADRVSEELDVDRGELRWRAHRNLIGLLFLEHRLAANDVRIAFTLGAHRMGAELVHWYYEPVIEEEVEDPIERSASLSFRPDAYLRLRLTGGRMAHAFLEVDRSSEGYVKIAAKVRRYLAYKEHHLFRSKVGARSFRVLFTVPTLRRLSALRRVIEEAGGRRMFWLARHKDVTEATFSAAVWQIAGSEDSGSLGATAAARQNLSAPDSGR